MLLKLYIYRASKNPISLKNSKSFLKIPLIFHISVNIPLSMIYTYVQIASIPPAIAISFLLLFPFMSVIRLSLENNVLPNGSQLYLPIP